MPIDFLGVDIPIFYSDPGGGPQLPPAPDRTPNKPPVISSAPLPSGSGARALGVAGAFTAVADDATAASWNPAGLTQLERPELSVVYRLSHERDIRGSNDSDYRVGGDEFDANAINYLSAVMPFRLFDRNTVFSLNYQEVFDFSQRYHAHSSDSGSSEPETTTMTDHDFIPINCDPATYRQIDLSHDTDLLFTPTLSIRRTFTQTESLNYSSLTDLEFEQEGAVQAITPAFAVEVTPKFSLGAALNVYQEGLLNTPDIRSRTRARYAGTLNRTILTSINSIDYDGTVDVTGTYNGTDITGKLDDLPVSWADHDPDDPDSTDLTRYRYTGIYDADDRISNFHGVNATLGSLLTVSEELTLGFCFDLPWKARARQTKTVRTEFELFDENGTSLGKTTGTSHESKKVEFDFPLYWAAGAVWRWNNRLSTSFDVSQTWWSDYSYKAEGESRKNPIDGSEYGDHSIDDCWSLRTGTEYLWVLKNTEIPLRAGLSWEQRPAVGSPDEYWGISLGTGISIGKGPNKVIIDVAYIYTWANEVMGSFGPSKDGDFDSDVQRHDIYVSCIYHF